MAFVYSPNNKVILICLVFIYYNLKLPKPKMFHALKKCVCQGPGIFEIIDTSSLFLVDDLAGKKYIIRN